MTDDLFDWEKRGVRPTDPETSHTAAKLHPWSRNTDRFKAFEVHARNPQGLTDFELADRMGRQQTSAGKRRGELRDLGLIEETDLRRRSPSLTPAIVWRISLRGLETWERFNRHNSQFRP